jgi:hypothetical protein
MGPVMPTGAGFVQRDERNSRPRGRLLASPHRKSDAGREHAMTKFYCLTAAIPLFFPVAFALTNQAAMIVA